MPTVTGKATDLLSFLRGSLASVTDADSKIKWAGHEPAELAVGGVGVAWIDPLTVETPSRIWAGGMSYWAPPVVL